jgi:hypothetical protein
MLCVHPQPSPAAQGWQLLQATRNEMHHVTCTQLHHKRTPTSCTCSGVSTAPGKHAAKRNSSVELMSQPQVHCCPTVHCATCRVLPAKTWMQQAEVRTSNNTCQSHQLGSLLFATCVTSVATQASQGHWQPPKSTLEPRNRTGGAQKRILAYLIAHGAVHQAQTTRH